jgi:hypothetical protein
MHHAHAHALAWALIATARPQRWKAAEIIKALVVEEVTRSIPVNASNRRMAAAFPAGRRSNTWDETATWSRCPRGESSRFAGPLNPQVRTVLNGH